MKKMILIAWALIVSCCLVLVQGAQADEPSNERVQGKKATFASGCFWCTQHDFDQVEGVLSTTVGYTGGEEKNPTYDEVSSGRTGHVEALQLKYDPAQVSYQELLDVYWHNVDPTHDDRQFCDVGSQYRPVIFYHDENQKELAEKYKNRLIAENRIHPILVQILPAQTFYPAEEYHQKYYQKHPLRYKFYRYICGRDRRLKEIWDTEFNHQTNGEK